MPNKVTFVFRLFVYVGRMGTVQLRILILINVNFWLFSCQWFGKELPSQSSQWNVWWTGKFRSFVSINQCNLNAIGSTIYLLIIMMFTTTNKLKREFCALFLEACVRTNWKSWNMVFLTTKATWHICEYKKYIQFPLTYHNTGVPLASDRTVKRFSLRYLQDNTLSTLPDGVFGALSKLKVLWVLVDAPWQNCVVLSKKKL